MPRVTTKRPSTIKSAPAKAVAPAPADREVRGKHAERRDEAERSMIRAAMVIVAKRGLDSITLAECGEAAGYSRGLAAHYFESKEGLIAAIARRIIEVYVQNLRAANRRRTRGLVAILRSVAFYIDSSRKDTTILRAFHAVLAAALRESPLSKQIALLNRASVDGFANGIRYGISQGEIRKDVDPLAQAVIIVGALRGIMAQWLLDPKYIDLDIVKRDLVRNLRRQLAA